MRPEGYEHNPVLVLACFFSSFVQPLFCIPPDGGFTKFTLLLDQGVYKPSEDGEGGMDHTAYHAGCAASEEAIAVFGRVGMCLIAYLEWRAMQKGLLFLYRPLAHAADWCHV